MSENTNETLFFAHAIETWYDKNQRHLPWRNITDPYRIWISEIILQQTQVAQGYDYFLRFVHRFPTVETLSSAPLDDVLQMWQGLGYYSRARNLHEAAKQIAEQGGFPTTYEGIRSLKGVGDYTAAAICSFAYGLPYATVDGNVYRVLARVFGIDTPIDTTKGKKEFAQLAQHLLDKNQPALYNQALMDFGALQCKPKSPNCECCPIANKCMALSTNSVENLPVKAKRAKVKNRHLVYLYVRCNGKILLRQRPAGDIWQGLYEPFLMEFDQQTSLNSVATDSRRSWLGDNTIYQPILSGFTHVLTHRRLNVDAYFVQIQNLVTPPEGYKWIEEAKRDEYPVSRLVEIIFESLNDTKTKISKN